MRIYLQSEIDPSLAFQAVDAGGGTLHIYAGGQRRGTYQLGAGLLASLASKVEYLTDERAEELLKGHCDAAARRALRFLRRPLIGGTRRAG